MTATWHLKAEIIYEMAAFNPDNAKCKITEAIRTTKNNKVWSRWVRRWISKRYLPFVVLCTLQVSYSYSLWPYISQHTYHSEHITAKIRGTSSAWLLPHIFWHPICLLIFQNLQLKKLSRLLHVWHCDCFSWLFLEFVTNKRPFVVEKKCELKEKLPWWSCSQTSTVIRYCGTF